MTIDILLKMVYNVDIDIYHEKCYKAFINLLQGDKNV